MLKLSKIELFIVLIAACLFIPYLGAVHLFDWDEINFAEAAREMIVTGDYFRVQIDFKPFWEKPPLFIWMQVLSMKAFGINEFAARFPNAVCGILTLLVLFRIGKRIVNEQFGILWTMVYAGTFLTFLYFKSGIIDPWFNLFIFLSVYYFSFLTLDNFQKRNRNALVSGLFLGLAVLTKGPVAILIVLLVLLVFYASVRFRKIISFVELLLIILSTALVCFAWFGVELLKNGPWFLQEFIVYQVRLFQTQDAGHGGPFFYHWIILLLGCFPASVFMIRAFFIKQSESVEQRNLYKWMSILFWVVLILFSIVKTKIVHYSSLCYFPLSFLAAYALYYLVSQRVTWSRWMTGTVLVIGFLVSTLLIAFPFLMMTRQSWVHLIKDRFAQGNLEAQINWSVLDATGGILLMIALVFFVILLRRQQVAQAVSVLFVSVTATVFITTLLIVPKVEQFSQAAAIRFYERMQGQDVYVQPMFFKSYAHLFYAHKQPVTNEHSYDHDWLRAGDIDKPVYVVVKNTKTADIEQFAGFERIGEENGFVFYVRKPATR